MAQIILSSRYIKNPKKVNAGKLVKYMGTREGVEKLPKGIEIKPATKKQQELINTITNRYPETNATNIGNRIMSSKYPKTGMKSGIKSIGERAYATVIPANAFASIGVSLSFNAKNIAGISVFNFFARSLRSIFISANLYLSVSII